MTRTLVLVLCAAAASGCSVKTMAAKAVADTLSAPSDVFSRDDDPELIRAAIPFGLKTYESLLETLPRHEALLIATCSGFTQYAYAFVQADADLVEHSDVLEARRLRERALKLYLRGWDYCARALEVRFPGSVARLMQDPGATVFSRAEKKDVPLLYWASASRGAAIALAPDKPDLMIDFPIVRSFAERALALDDTWDRGALHELMITLESQQTLGGSEERARKHFERAVALQNGRSPGPYVALAVGIAMAKQDRAEFQRLLEQALAVDPEQDKSRRLPTIITLRRARSLLDRIDQIFSE